MVKVFTRFVQGLIVHNCGAKINTLFTYNVVPPDYKDCPVFGRSLIAMSGQQKTRCKCGFVKINFIDSG